MISSMKEDDHAFNSITVSQVQDLDPDLIKEIIKQPESIQRDHLIQIAKTHFYKKKIHTCYSIEE